ncbi:lysophospholipid acyltransferase family protein [Mucilaginibacter sp. AW1-3]
MITPRRHWLITPFFSVYIGYIIKRNFHSVNFNKVTPDPAKAVLLIANHFSWWDGLVLYYLNKIYFKKQFRIMVLEETMKEISFFKYLGAFSVNKNSRQVVESLNYAAGSLNDPENMVVIFPQGKLYSNFVDSVTFEKGLSKITDMAIADFQYLFCAAFTENFDHQKPSVNIGFKIVQSNTLTAEEVQEAYQQHYDLTKQHQTQIVV